MESIDIFNISSEAEFAKKALQTFLFQYNNVEVYKTYVDLLKINPKQVDSIDKIPFLPIQFFKTHKIIAKGYKAQETFTSSGTTGTETSSHLVPDVNRYIESFTRGFRYFYGDPANYVILALLPAYLERTGSSLVFMADGLIKQSGKSESGFYLYQYDELVKKLIELSEKNVRVLLLGVSFALLDLAERYNISLENAIVMETGGMKGRRKELIRNELHQLLQQAFGVKSIHSEYGMTELLSQAYSKGNGIFKCPPWMKVLVRDPSDPLTATLLPMSGVLNIIDLANTYSCSFIQTQDLGTLHADGSFEVLGRMDSSPVRGCNLLIYE